MRGLKRAEAPSDGKQRPRLLEGAPLATNHGGVLMSVDVGKAVPDFTCIADDENPRSLSAEAGNWVVVFFYPKASTPGCTIESKDFSATQKRV